MTISIKLHVVEKTILEVFTENSKFKQIRLEEINLDGVSISAIHNHVYVKTNPNYDIYRHRIRCWNTFDVFILKIDRKTFQLEEVEYENGNKADFVDHDLIKDGPFEIGTIIQLDPFNIIALKQKDNSEKLLIVDFNKNAWMEE